MQERLPSLDQESIVNKKIGALVQNLLAFKLNEGLKKDDDEIAITVKKFKKINSVTLKLQPVNIFIGANNSGKSSFIQGIQFAISSCQTLQLKKVNWVRKNDSRTLSLDSSEFLYSPTRHIEHLYHGHKLTGAKTTDNRKSISFEFTIGQNRSAVNISRGKNGGFTTIHKGKSLGNVINNIENPFCVYVPGIAGIPIDEKFEVNIALKKSAIRGNSNNYLRNILLRISDDYNKWQRFHSSVNKIYTNTIVEVVFDQNYSEYIEVYVNADGISLPIDSVGTGLLQTIQIFAYIEFFSPRILLLDEPDSHVHPTKQHLMAKELLERASNTEDLRIVFSTHSRYILDSLEKEAQVVHFQNGEAFTGIQGSKILLDIGAADADYLFSKKNLKYIIATEDKVDNVEEKKMFIKKFANANGLSDDEFVLHSYEGCSKVHFGKLLEGFVRKHIPNVKVILHIDRDQRTDDDHELVKLREDCATQKVMLFVTEFSEMESYFCHPSHINAIYGLSAEICKTIYEDALNNLRQETLDKLQNFWVRNRPEKTLNKDGKYDVREVRQRLDTIYVTMGEYLTPGKEMLGKIKANIQQNYKLQPNDLLRPSEGLRCKNFQQLITENTSIDTLT